MKVLFAAAMMLAAISLGGCSTLAALSGASTTAAVIAGPTPGQATTLADAILVADAATKGVKFAVDTVKLPPSTLTQLSALSDGVHAALSDLEQANAAGQALDFAAFNAAVAAYNAYAVAHGIGAAVKPTS